MIFANIAFLVRDFENNYGYQINLDWYRPELCHRHTKEEVLSYIKKCNLKKILLKDVESGFSFIAKKE